MNVTFVALGSTSLGIEHLAAYLKRAGHSVALVFDPGLFDNKRYGRSPRLAKIVGRPQRIAETILAGNPGLVAFSVLSDTYRWALDIAGRVKGLDSAVPIVFGGFHPSLVPERVIARPEVDFLVQGEGEEALLELVGRIERGDEPRPMANLWLKQDDELVFEPPRALIQDLDSLPYPDKRIYGNAVRVQDYYGTVTGRGCPFSCNFCSHNALRRLYPGDRYLRRRSPEHVLGELKATKARHGLRYVKFEDDIFTMNKSWLARFLPAYREEIGAPFGCIIHPEFLDDDIALMLQESGCSEVEVGVQTLEESVRRDVLGRNEPNEAIYRTLDILDRHGLRFIVDHMMDLPGETDEGLREAIRRYSELDTLVRVTCFHLTYFPRTDIVQKGLEAGLIDQDDVERMEEGETDHYFYPGRNRERGRDSRLARRAETLFKLLPLLPPRARRIAAGPLFPTLDRLPTVVTTPLMVAAGIARRDPSTAAYLRFYLDHLAFFVRDEIAELKSEG